MTHRSLAMLLVMAMLGVCLQASAGGLVAPKLLAPTSGLRVVTPNLGAAFDAGTVPFDQPPAKHQRWIVGRTGNSTDLCLRYRWKKGLISI